MVFRPSENSTISVTFISEYLRRHEFGSAWRDAGTNRQSGLRRINGRRMAVCLQWAVVWINDVQRLGILRSEL